MTTGVKLRCIVSRNKDIVVGKYYEVAEILEHPGHAMLRKPNGKWPKPGDPYFAWHADELFESPPNGIPAFSCGYDHEELEFFGTIIPNSLLPTLAEWDPFDRSTQQAREEFSDIVDSAGIPDLWSRTYHRVLPRVCIPDSLERSFLLLGVDFQHLGRRCTKPSISRAIRKVMRKLGILTKSMPRIEEQSIEFWRRSWRKPGPWTWKSPPKSA